MQHNKLVSIIVPVFNIEPPLLTKCINSLLRQDYTNFEILLIDDGSESDIAALCDDIAFIDDRIKVFHKKNGGVSSARNLGINNASGAYIAFVDGDDWVDNNFISLLVFALQSQVADLSIVGVDYVYTEGILNNIIPTVQITKNVLVLNKSELYAKLLYSEYIGGYLCNKLFKKELINRLLDECLYICEDFEFVADYCQNISCAAYVDIMAYHYLQKSDGSFKVPSYSSRSFSLISAREKITDIYRRNSPENVIEMEKSVLKVALNLRARYKLSKINNKQEYAVIRSTIKKYFKKIIVTNDIFLLEKVNIIFTYAFPGLLLRIKTAIIEGRRKNV